MKDLESLINTATDPTLTTDNWQYILDVCDSINASPESQTKPAIKIITARFSQKDANILLRTLSLLIALAENCGSRLKQEIASKSFINDVLLSKLNDRKTHKAIKIQVVQAIIQLYESSKLDPSLKPISDAYKKIKSTHPEYLPPSKPKKTKISSEDKNKEDDELQRILNLSLQEYEREQSLKTISKNKPLPQITPAPLKQQNSGNDEPNIATVSKVRALYDLISYEPDELSFRKGDVITVIESVYRDWWRGLLTNGKVGIFPLNYVTPIIKKSLEELAKEIEQEDKILQDTKKIDRLLELLSSSNPDESEITHLYNSVIPSRPQLSRCIEKYGIRKEELFVLNKQLNSEVKQYNELMDNMIASRTGGYNNHANSTPYPLIERSDLPLRAYPTGQSFNSQSQSNLPKASPQLFQQPVNQIHNQAPTSLHPFQSQASIGQENNFQGYNPTGQSQPKFQKYTPTGQAPTANHNLVSSPANRLQNDNSTGLQPSKFQNYNPTGTTSYPHHSAQVFNSSHTSNVNTGSPRESRNDQNSFDNRFGHHQTSNHNAPPTSFNSYSPSSPGDQYTGDSNQYQNQRQQFQYLQQQPTSTAFGNDPNAREFLNINKYPDVNEI